EVTTYHARFPKNVFLYKIFTVFGENILSSEGEEWKKYRKIAAPAFSEKNNRLVWDETIRTMMDLFDNVWGNRSKVVIDHCVDITFPITLFVIGAAGRFGRRVTWTSDLVVPPGHQITFKDAIHVLSANLILKLSLPDWAKYLTAHTRKVEMAFAEFKQYMLEMVEARRNADKVEERYDLFSGLLDAARDEPDSEAALTDEELIGNMFFFFLAGHETTAHTLCFSFALLALYPDEQERLYQHIKGVMSSLNGMPVGSRNHNLYRADTPVMTIPKIATKDTTLTVNNVDGGKTTFPVPSGTGIDLHVAGLHYNPRYWKEPHKFMPEQFLGDWPKDAFIPFSQGARACVGRRFAETEGIAVITMLVSRYKIEVKEEPEFVGETFEERYARVTAFRQSLSTTPIRVPLSSSSQWELTLCHPSAPPILTHIWLCPHLYPSFFPSSDYFSYTSCWESEGSLAMSGQCDFDLEIFSLSILSETHTTVFATAGQDAFAMVAFLAYFTGGGNSQQYKLQISALPVPSCIIHVADAAAIKVRLLYEITTYRARFPKPVFRYEGLSIFGANIVASEGEEWKKYRKIAAPAFSEKNNKLVWDEAIRIMMDLFDNVWGDKSEVVVDHCADLTLPISVAIVSWQPILGFGRRVTWTTNLIVPPGHRMTFKDALHILSTNIVLKIVIPNWAKNLTNPTRKVNLAFTELKQYMLEMVEDRKDADKVEERYDLFSGLLDAAQDEPGSEAALSDDELIGNMFIFLLAGHETTAHTLCFSFALLALYPAEQERLYQHIRGVMSSLNGMPMQTIRYYDQVAGIPKVAAQDTTLTVSNANGGKTTFPVPAGTQVELHAVGLHYNHMLLALSRYWNEPHKFMPERFLGDWPKDAFIPYSQGARACLGRRFFETEGIAIVTMLVSRYKIEVKEEPEFASETFEERYARITAFGQGITTM
ncbi:cytochrome P450, partial [Russula decolorans]